MIIRLKNPFEIRPDTVENRISWCFMFVPPQKDEFQTHFWRKVSSNHKFNHKMPNCEISTQKQYKTPAMSTPTNQRPASPARQPMSIDTENALCEQIDEFIARLAKENGVKTKVGLIF